MMTGAEIRKIRLALELSFEEFARLLKLTGKDSARHVRRLENEERFLSEENEKILRDYLRDWPMHSVKKEA